MPDTESRIETDAQGVTIERTFAAAQAEVWQAWTDPERFARWYGPQGFTIPSVEMDVRVGGEYSLTMRSPDGWEMRNVGAFQEIEAPDRFVATMSADVHDETTIEVRLEALDDGRTRMTLRHSGWASEEMAQGAGGGWTQAFDKLEAELAGG